MISRVAFSGAPWREVSCSAEVPQVRYYDRRTREVRCRFQSTSSRETGSFFLPPNTNTKHYLEMAIITHTDPEPNLGCNIFSNASLVCAKSLGAIITVMHAGLAPNMLADMMCVAFTAAVVLSRTVMAVASSTGTSKAEVQINYQVASLPLQFPIKWTRRLGRARDGRSAGHNSRRRLLTSTKHRELAETATRSQMLRRDILYTLIH